MLQKFALAVKNKTVEFFAEEEEEEEEEERQLITNGAVDEVITGQRVVVIRPDAPIKPTTSFSSYYIPPPSHHLNLQRVLVSSLFTTISSFHAAYLQLQTAHEPFDRVSIESADKIAVSHLRRLTDIKKAYKGLSRSAKSAVPLTSESEAQVQENQCMLRMLETLFNRLQHEVDEKDAKVLTLKQELKESEQCNALMERSLDGVGSSSSGFVEEKSFFSIGLFESVLKECCKEVHRFAKVLLVEMKKSGWDLDLVANSMYPNVDYAKRGHHQYAFLSYICLEMFSGFGSDGFGPPCNGEWIDGFTDETSRRESLSQFVEHLTVDAMEMLRIMPNSSFALFCKNKYRKLIRPEMETSLFGDMDWWDPVLRPWKPSSPLYEPYVTMCSLIWMLHKLALAIDHPVEIFQADQGEDFSIVYMEDIVQNVGSKMLCCLKARPKVAFTIFPGFLVGSMVIQCKVYLIY